MPTSHSDYIVFVDESGDHSLTQINPDYPVFVLAFCVLPFENYNATVAPAMRALKFAHFGHDCVVFHERELRKKHGAFSKLGAAERTALMSSLSDIISASDMTVIAVAIDKAKHRARYVKPVHPYHLAMEFGLERLYRYMGQKGQQDRLTHVICEARGGDEDRDLELIFRRVCDGANHKGVRMSFDMIVADKRCNSEGLQLADLVARPIGRHVLNPQQPNTAFDVIGTKLMTGAWGKAEGYGLKVFP